MRDNDDLDSDVSCEREEKEAELVRVRSNIDRACSVVQVQTAYLALSPDVRESLPSLATELRSEMIRLMNLRDQESELVLFLEKN